MRSPLVGVAIARWWVPFGHDVLVMATTADALSRCLALDLEVSRKDGRIYAFAGVAADTDRRVVWAKKSRSTEQPNECVAIYEGDRVVWTRPANTANKALVVLDKLAEGAEFVVGHNLIDFDLPRLQAAVPELQLLALPAVDTLWLNPLAFPRHPYHHLVKHYKDAGLVRSELNDPCLDAQLALQVLSDQRSKLAEAPSELLVAWHWLTAGGERSAGFDRFFTALRGVPRPDVAQARDAIRSHLENRVCRSHLHRAVGDAAEHGWALAYAMAWIWESGGSSVMPPWVRHRFPEAGRLVRRLRDEACSDDRCTWCRSRHDATGELRRLFGFESFRAEPALGETKQSMQQAIVEAVMGSEDVLAILPTGTGKSLCYQLPALSRYDKTGALTVVLSPLVALMADQVAGLQKLGVTSCVSVNGLLSSPERSEALERVRLGDAAILLISPEQLRSVSVRNALDQREIGAWVLDEAHCLSKWGHDFRPDYRYVGRFIRERAQNERIPPVLCLTATAKPEVKTEICDYFREHLGVDMRVFDGGSRRANLEFEVVQTSASAKRQDILATLQHHLPSHTDGGAIVYCATRRGTEEVADFLQAQGIAADRFHARVPPEEKKTIQQRFIEGELRVIAATNAFGMGIDKPNVRLVVHADIPSSLENYLQEAGRAGRDREPAHCVLLYTNKDVERQFGLSAMSRLTRREIHGVLRALRTLDRRGGRRGAVVATPGEILVEEETEDFQRDSATDDTRVRTAVAWLEEAELLVRDENRVMVFPSSLRVNTVQEAKSRLTGSGIDPAYQAALLSVVARLIDANPDEGISTDMLMSMSGLGPDQVSGALHKLEQLGLATNDTVVTAFVHVGAPRPSRRRLAQAAELEQLLIEQMREMAHDLDVGESALMNLRVASQRLQEAGLADVRPEHITRTLQGLARDGIGPGGSGGSVALRKHGAESMSVTLRRSWHQLEGIAGRRRSAAGTLLDHLLEVLPARSRGSDLLAETTLGKLQHAVDEAIEADPSLNVGSPDAERRLMERALLWLHEQEVVRLNRGLTVFRSAMSITLEPETRGFWQSDFAELAHHYDRTVRQIHVMAAYAEQGLVRVADAVCLALDYFTYGDDEFVRRWLPGRRGEIDRETTPESWRAIVESLSNPRQRALVADNREATNVLVLAGPGSGKTRVLVHRIAYLIRVRRQNSRGILALAYNRHAAADIRRRLHELVGDDANGVTVLTCHALAMRLVGASFSGTAALSSTRSFDELLSEVMRKAIALLRGDEFEPDEVEDSRARLLTGFRWILVDEYQDIGDDEYELIAALAGRTAADADTRLTIFAVGDDDQNIYAFNGTSPKFIRRFEEDYSARPAFLVDNYRSNGHIIDAANVAIAPAKSRMKTGHAIRIDRARRGEPAGGDWESLDPVAKGRVQMLHPAEDFITQAQAAMVELRRLEGLAPNWNWANCAVIAREWSYLEPVRSICEQVDIPVQLANEGDLSLWHLRETQALIQKARRHRGLLGSDALRRWIIDQRGPWIDLLTEAIAEHEIETGGADVPAVSFIEWLAEWCRDARRRQRGLLLLTAHRAKGLEFDHVIVLDGGWSRLSRDEDADAPRRLYYVAMTRAKQTLTLCRLRGERGFHDVLDGMPSVLWRSPVVLPPPTPELARRYRSLTLKDVYLSFAGRMPAGDSVHRSIRALSPGDPLQAREHQGKWELRDSNGVQVGMLSRWFEAPSGMRCVEAKVSAIATWSSEYSEAQYKQELKCDHWEVVVPELVFEPEDEPRDQ
ncbi:RecQ family ATP-dependent DNA helicase [Candidatus Poriferisodalis sp.]|uniref:RecQ family ATP-dependent DNA helicase n=1 Tax=Candidatus Poriferisodalis sp. TaxID=3101277 RepID=UPI003B01B2FA